MSTDKVKTTPQTQSDQLRPASATSSFSRLWLALIGVNIVLGVVLWFMLTTDYSWDNKWANYSFPLIVGVIGVATWFASRKERVTPLVALSGAPSMLGCLGYIVLIPVIFFLMMAAGAPPDQPVQQTISPDGLKVAEAYVIPFRAEPYGGSQIRVRLKYTWLPFIKRDIKMALFGSVNPPNTTTYLIWKDNETIYSEWTGELRPGLIGPRVLPP